MAMLKRPFIQLGADLSLSRPGFALLRCMEDATVELLGKCHIQRKPSERRHGPVLEGIYSGIQDWIAQADVLVRERGFARFRNETLALFKVLGVADLAAWHTGKMIFDELAPKSIKKIVTGSGIAGKDEVAAALEQYVGKQTYACDDESDAVAVGVAWLLQNKWIEVGGERQCIERC